MDNENKRTRGHDARGHVNQMSGEGGTSTKTLFVQNAHIDPDYAKEGSIWQQVLAESAKKSQPLPSKTVLVLGTRATSTSTLSLTFYYYYYFIFRYINLTSNEYIDGME